MNSKVWVKVTFRNNIGKFVGADLENSRVLGEFLKNMLGGAPMLARPLYGAYPQPAKTDLNKKSLPKQKTIQNLMQMGRSAGTG